MTKQTNKIRLAAVGDIHVKEHMQGAYKELFTQVSEDADVLLLCGDLTDLGLISEAEHLREDMRNCRIPIMAVLGNHDYQSEKQAEVKQILQQLPHVTILDQEPEILSEIGFAGVKGFIGGFDAFSLSAFGEPALKAIITERDKEAYALENQLKDLHGKTEKIVVLMHYSPIKATIADEPEAIHPFLGATRYEQIIDQFGASVVFHGHANMGPHAGKTSKGIPVFNVALPLLETLEPKLQYKIYEL